MTELLQLPVLRALRGRDRASGRRIGLAAIAIVAAIAGVVAIVLAGGRGDTAVPTAVTAEGGLAVTAQQSQGGVANAQTVTGPEPLSIALYTDYTHPDSARFASSNALVIQGLIQDGAAEVSIFPVAVGDDPESYENAVRVGNAVACVGEHAPKSLWSFQMALLAMQPHGEGAQLRDADLVTVARDSDVQHIDEVTECIDDERFGDWIDETTAAARSEGIGARSIELGRMPAVIVDDALYQGSIDSSVEFRGFVSERIGDRFDT